MSLSTTAVLTSRELRDRLKSDTPPRLLDVRTPAEFETSHIAGAHNVPLDLIRERTAEIIDGLSGDVVFVCRSGQRAAQADELLRSAGLPRGSVLKGGILAWEGNGFEVDRGTERWDLERQVRLVAGSIVLSSVVGSIAVPKLPYNRTDGYDAATLVKQVSQ